MPKMDHTGPEGEGPRTGRRLGRCRQPDDSFAESEKFELGQGMGLRRKSGGGKGKGRRLQAGQG